MVWLEAQREEALGQEYSVGSMEEDEWCAVSAGEWARAVYGAYVQHLLAALCKTSHTVLWPLEPDCWKLSDHLVQ